MEFLRSNFFVVVFRQYRHSNQANSEDFLWFVYSFPEEELQLCIECLNVNEIFCSAYQLDE